MIRLQMRISKAREDVKILPVPTIPTAVSRHSLCMRQSEEITLLPLKIYFLIELHVKKYLFLDHGYGRWPKTQDIYVRAGSGVRGAKLKQQRLLYKYRSDPSSA